MSRATRSKDTKKQPQSEPEAPITKAKDTKKAKVTKDAKESKETKEIQESKKEVQEEIKPEVKAKKYKKKSYEELSRINRSKYERIFLMSVTRNEDNWEFKVQGQSGSQYHVRISREVKCSCMDFKFKKTPCKHIYFIITQVGQNEELLDYFKKDTTISKNAYTILDSQLHDRLKKRMEQNDAKVDKDIDLKDDTDCVICFSEMEKETEPLEDCSTCKKYFHSQCISAWKNHNPSCPLCRGALSGGGNSNDPFSKLTGMKI